MKEIKVYNTIVTRTFDDTDGYIEFENNAKVYDNTFASLDAAISKAKEVFDDTPINDVVHDVVARVIEIVITDKGMEIKKVKYHNCKRDYFFLRVKIKGRSTVLCVGSRERCEKQRAEWISRYGKMKGYEDAELIID